MGEIVQTLLKDVSLAIATSVGSAQHGVGNIQHLILLIWGEGAPTRIGAELGSISSSVFYNLKWMLMSPCVGISWLIQQLHPSLSGDT